MGVIKLDCETCEEEVFALEKVIDSHIDQLIVIGVDVELIRGKRVCYCTQCGAETLSYMPPMIMHLTSLVEAIHAVSGKTKITVSYDQENQCWWYGKREFDPLNEKPTSMDT